MGSEMCIRDREGTERLKYLQTHLNKAVADVLGSSPGLDMPLMAAGLTSLGAVQLMDRCQELSEGIGISLPPTLVFDYPTIRAVAGFMDATLTGEKAAVSGTMGSGTSQYRPHVCTHSSLLPGSTVPDCPWDLCSDSVSVVPPSRYDLMLAAQQGSSVPCSFGAFMPDVSAFDRGLFFLSSTEAELMDPQQRLLLERHATIFPTMSASTFSSTGVYVGISSNDYQIISTKGSRAIHPYSATGLAFSVASGRASFVFGFTGPSMTIDTACSSSLVAGHLACRDIKAATSVQAFVSGCNVTLSLPATMAFLQANMLSTDGRCKTLDSSADGYVRSEACISIMLSNGSDEEGFGGTQSTIFMPGSFVNQDGRSSALTAPNGPSQQSAISSSMESAGLGAQDCVSMHMHGTGTLGDPIEVGALLTVLTRNPNLILDPVILCSSKSHLGHGEPSAGVAGVLFAIKGLDHRYGSNVRHCRSMNPLISDMVRGHRSASLSVLRGGAGVVTTASTKRGISTGVSGFAFQGTNAHVSMLQDENYSTACSMARLSYLSFARERLWAAGPCAADLTSMKFGAMRRGDIVFSLPRSVTSLGRDLACFAENQIAGLSLVHQIFDFLHRATKSVVLTQIAFSNLRQLGSG